MAKTDDNPIPHPNPPPQAGEGEKPEMQVAHRSGPYEIHFCGRTWFRDQAQRVTVAEWAAMKARADFGEFGFTEEN